MEKVEKEDQGIKMHPEFESVCLNRRVLQTAGIGLKSKSTKSYTTMLALGDRAGAEAGAEAEADIAFIMSSSQAIVN